MNFTDNYIEMCINNVNIQNLCRHNKGDWFYNGEKPYLYCKSGLGSSNPHDYSWLPTLEQLWNILHKYYEVCNDSPVRWGKSINKFIMVALYEETISIHDYCLADMKEYLLYFVMRNVYNRSWNGKEWEEM